MQHVAQNSYKQKHSHKFQAIKTPDCIYIYLFKLEGRWSCDVFLYAATKKDKTLPTLMIMKKKYTVFGEFDYKWRVSEKVLYGDEKIDNKSFAFNKEI